MLIIKRSNSALVKNNELPFIRRGIHTYFLDSNKERGVTSARLLSRLIGTSGYSEPGNHMLMSLDLFISSVFHNVYVCLLARRPRRQWLEAGGGGTHRVYANDVLVPSRHYARMATRATDSSHGYNTDITYLLVALRLPPLFTQDLIKLPPPSTQLTIYCKNSDVLTAGLTLYKSLHEDILKLAETRINKISWDMRF